MNAWHIIAYAWLGANLALLTAALAKHLWRTYTTDQHCDPHA